MFTPNKEVGGYLTRCALPRRSLKLIIMNHSVSHSLTRVGIELLGQLKSVNGKKSENSVNIENSVHSVNSENSGGITGSGSSL